MSDFNPVTLFFILSEGMGGWLWLLLGAALLLLCGIVFGLTRLRRAGINVLNQAVLLRGVNEQLQDQLDLCEGLGDLGIQPYYLHQLDPVQGAAHFQVSDAQATALHGQMLARLPGYLVPRLVREVPERPGKTPIPTALPD